MTILYLPAGDKSPLPPLKMKHGFHRTEMFMKVELGFYPKAEAGKTDNGNCEMSPRGSIADPKNSRRISILLRRSRRQWQFALDDSSICRNMCIT